jgi:phosphoglucomutase
MAAYYKKQGKTLADKLEELYKMHGYFLNRLIEFVFEGEQGAYKMAEIMDAFRNEFNDKEDKIAGKKVTKVIDFKKSAEFPSINALEFVLEDGGGLIIRPSGTEPKLKIYLTAVGSTRKEAEQEAELMTNALGRLLKNSLQI